MGNGHCVMSGHCYLCKDELTKSYFLRINGLKGFIVEVCPECHHYYKYSEPDLLEHYKKRRGIKL